MWWRHDCRLKPGRARRTIKDSQTHLSRFVCSPSTWIIGHSPTSWIIDQEEGFKALFKGGPARVIRSSPQFGFTLLAYEYLHKVGPPFIPMRCADHWSVSPWHLRTAVSSGKCLSQHYLNDGWWFLRSNSVSVAGKAKKCGNRTDIPTGWSVED